MDNSHRPHILYPRKTFPPPYSALFLYALRGIVQDSGRRSVSEKETKKMQVYYDANSVQSAQGKV